jgi:hypothetical protein
MAALLAASGALGGCGEAGEAPGPPVPAPDAGPLASDTPGDAAEVTAGDVEVVGGPDARAPGFELGSNPQGANTPSAFSALSEGDPLEIVYGPQGLWMVVLAFRTRGLVTAPLALEAEIRTASRTLGALSLIEQPLFPGPEGWGYHYNFFLVVDDPTAAGQAATIAFSAVDASGARVDTTLGVTLAGGL